MDSIRLQNLRSLSDTGEVALSPITLLVGQNNSGKSTFLRAFPLLRQSVESRTSGPILWYGPFVDFGSFAEAVRRGATEPEITIEFKFRSPIPMMVLGQRQHPYLREWTKEPFPAGVSITIGEVTGRGLSFAKRLLVTFAGHEVSCSFDNEAHVTQLLVNKRDFSEFASSLRGAQRGVLPRLFSPTLAGAERRPIFHSGSALWNLLVRKVRPLVHGKAGMETIQRLADRLRLAPPEEMLSAMQRIPEPESWRHRVAAWTTSTPEFVELRDLVVANSIGELLAVCDDRISMFARSVRYIGPVRATAERYYRVQNLAVDEVDFQGQNLAMFLNSLTGVEQKRFSEWTERLFGFVARPSATAGHASLKLKEAGGITEDNLADTGFGFSQILPILAQLWSATYRYRQTRPTSKDFELWEPDRPLTIAIEQPELHLHPRLQAKLVDSFVHMVRQAREDGFDLRMVLETHSETMVNRFGIRVAVGDLPKDDISVLLFEKPGPDADTRVTKACYDDKGFLTDWPFGFFEPKEG